MIGDRSSPAGSVPNAPPQSAVIRLARNASVTAGWPKRTSREPCNARLMSSAILRARYSSVAASARLLRNAAVCASSLGSLPPVPASSSKSTSTHSGRVAIARRVSSALTLPEPSQMPISGASRYSRGMPESSA